MSSKAPATSLVSAALVLVAAAATVFFTLALAAAWEHTADDAYITLRYARNLASGESLTWNPGEAPVEGYSNFLYVLLGAVLIALGGPAEAMLWVKGLGALAAFAALAATYALSRDLALAPARPEGTSRHARALGARAGVAALGIAAALMLLVHPGQAFWAVSGMETALCQLFVVLAAWAVSRALRDPNSAAPLLLAASLLVFLGSITRPETPVVLAAFLPAVALGPSAASSAKRFRSAAWLLVPFLVLYLPYTAWRLATFGRLLPNSAACKAGMADAPFLLGRGFVDFAWPLLALGLVGLALKPRREHWYLLGIPLLYLGVFYGVDPVMSHLDRHFLVALPFVAVGAVHGLGAVLERLAPRRLEPLQAGAVLAAALLYGGLSAPGTLAAVKRGVSLAHPQEELRRELAAYLAERLEPSETFAIGDTGLVPFLVGNAVLDVYCLNCREATEPPIDRSPERLADWILAQNPRFVVIQIVAGAAERGVFPADQALQRHHGLKSRYRLRSEFGGAEDPLHYQVYERRGGASL